MELKACVSGEGKQPQTIADGTATSFTLTPDAHYRIDTVSGCNGTLQGQVYTTAAISADCTVTAAFAPITHVVTPQAGAGGTIAPDLPQTIDEGTSTSFTLTPDAGQVIDQVSGCGGVLAGATYTTAPIATDCTVSVTFVLDPDLIFRNGFDAVTH